MTAIHYSENPAFDRAVAGGGPDVLVVCESDRRVAAQSAVRGAGGTMLGVVAWNQVGERLEQQTLLQSVFADARGADPATVVGILPLLDALGRSGETQLVVVFDIDQIDLIAAGLTTPAIQLLCDPAPHEQIVALSLAGLAGGGGKSVHDIGREAEAARLQRLNEEVARIAETLARLTRGEAPPRSVPSNDTVADRNIGYRGPPSEAAAPDIAARDIRDAIRARRLRDQYFGGGLFEDPAWDMLLDLFAAELERGQVSVSSLCIAAAVAPTTALRWISRMTEAGLFERQPDPFDRRRAFMGLSDRASAGMRNYVTAVRRAGTAIA